ncbi:MAG: DNA primase [Acidimicrobiales bacterium]
MGIVDEDIARVRDATDTLAVIGEQVALRRAGSRWVGLCPFHAEKSPSFSVNGEEGLFYCFGCQARGDVITFVRETQHLDFASAVEFLATRAGVTLRYDTPGATREHHRRSTLTDAMESAVEWYHQRLLTAKDAAAARRYLRERGYDADTVRSFRLGWAPEGWDELCRALKLPGDVLHDTGLGYRGKTGKLLDFFRGRVMFPIFDSGGRPVAFGGRIMPGHDGPKYKNSPEGALYSKRRVLYGLNWSKADVVAAGEVIVCEGYTDVIAFHRSGLPRAVATCGTSLADEHMTQLKNFARRIILAYDADSAGQGAAEKFYGWEQRLELDIHVLRLPAGSDPGELGARDPDALRAAVATARPFLEFRLERLRESADLSTVEGRARFSERALEAIAAHPSALVRDQYVMAVADWARVSSADRLRDRLEEIRRNPKPVEMERPRRSSARDESTTTEPGRTEPGRIEPGSDEPDSSWDEPRGWGSGGSEGAPGKTRAAEPAAPAHGAELEALRLAVHRPETVAHLLEDVLFDNAVHLAAFHALVDATTLQQAIESAPPEVEALLHRLAVEEPDPAAEADDVLAILVRRAATQALAGIEAQARASQQVVDLSWPKRHIEALSDVDRRLDAAGQLVAWLSGEGDGRVHDGGGADALDER